MFDSESGLVRIIFVLASGDRIGRFRIKTVVKITSRMS